MGFRWSRSVQDCKSSGVCSEQALPLKEQLKDETALRGKRMEMEGLPLLFSSFAFYKDHFYQGVAVLRLGDSGFEDLRKALAAKHGQPKREGTKWASWQLGATRITLSGEDKTCGVVYLQEPTFKTVAKLKGIPLSAPPPAAAPTQKKTQKKQ